MRLRDRFSRVAVVRLEGALVSAMALAACCVGVSSAAAEGLIRTIPIASPPHEVSSNGTFAWVADEEGVAEIEASTGIVVRTIPSANAHAVSADGTHVWVGSDGEHNWPNEGAVSE